MTIWIKGLKLDHFEPEIKKHLCPILYLPGLHEGQFFEKWLRASQADGWDSFALKYRGHNGSRPVKAIGKVSIYDYAQDVLDVIEYMGSPVILVGHSLGGLVGMYVAIGNLNVAGLVLVSSVPPGGIRLKTSITSLLRYIRNPAYIGPFLFKKALSPQRSDMYNLILNGFPEEERAEIFQKFVPDSGLVTRQIGLGAIRINPGDIDCPVLVVSPIDDRLVGERIQRQIAKMLGAEYMDCSGAHMLPSEKDSQKSIKKILEWIVKVVE